MPPFDISFNIDMLILLVIIVLSMLVGFFFKSMKINKKNRRIAELEQEMMRAHAEVLVVQKEYCELESRMINMPIPVIPMKHAAKEEEKEQEKSPDNSAVRKNKPNRTA